MVLALNIPVNAASSVVDVYDRIFQPESDYCIYKKTYDRGGAAGEEMRQKLHRLSQDMALWIFNNNYKEETIPLGKLEELAKKNGVNPKKGLDHFKKIRHSESNSATVSFIHRSLMEYFVADSIARVVIPNRNVLAENSAKAVQNVCRMCYHQDIASGEILSYLEIMLAPGFEALKEDKRQTVYQQWELIVFQQLEKGMPPWGTAEMEDSNYIDRLRAGSLSCQNFLQILYLIRMFCDATGKIGSFAYERIGDIRYKRTLSAYIRSSQASRWILFNCDLHHADLHRVDLFNAALIRADLSSSDLSSSDLCRADLSFATLCDANLYNADLRKAHLWNTDLRGSNLRGADLNDVKLTKDSAEGMIHELSSAKFDSIFVWNETASKYILYTREEFFSEFAKQ